MTRRVLLHVGTPKTGTSYLQDVLFRNRDLLVEHGIHYPADRFDAHFLAALDLMRLRWGGLEKEAVGAWDRLAAQVMAVEDGTVVISHEILAHASRSEAERARRSLGAGPDGDTELHVVVSARDLARQVPAEWQENIKHRATLSYATFLQQLQEPERSGRIASWFWRVQELPDILERWGAGLPPERIHVVTVPPPGSDRDLLWKRFVEAFGLDGVEFRLDEDVRANQSLGSAETALLRRLNRRVNKVVAPADYRPLVRELLAHRTLSQSSRSPRLTVPPALRSWVQELSESWVADLRERRYDVVGSLEELVGTYSEEEYADPDRPRPRLLVQASMDALEALLVEAARLRAEEERLHHDVAEAHLERDRALAQLALLRDRGFKRRLYLRMESSRAGQQLLGVYRRVRGRSSRAA